MDADLRGLQAGLEGVLGCLLGRTEADGGELVEPGRTATRDVGGWVGKGGEERGTGGHGVGIEKHRRVKADNGERGEATH